MAVGTASESLNEWADEEAGIEAVQRVLDALDDIHALQDAFVDQDVLMDMLRDVRLHALLQVTYFNRTNKYKILLIKITENFSCLIELVALLCHHQEHHPVMQYFVVVIQWKPFLLRLDINSTENEMSYCIYWRCPIYRLEFLNILFLTFSQTLGINLKKKNINICLL